MTMQQFGEKDPHVLYHHIHYSLKEAVTIHLVYYTMVHLQAGCMTKVMY